MTQTEKEIFEVVDKVKAAIVNSGGKLDKAIGSVLQVDNVEEVIKESSSVAKVEEDQDLEEPPKFDIFAYITK